MAINAGRGSGDRFATAIQRFDAANSQDPNLEMNEAGPLPRELLYSQWLTDWVLRLKPNASESLRLAARAQHICRWLIPRGSCPQTREGYLKWRADLKQMHALKAAEILREAGYGEDEISRVRDLIAKKLYPKEEDARILEDALCLVFLERQLSQLAAKSTEDKMVNALRKAWKKMSPAAQQIALTLPYGASEKALLEKALS